MVLVKKGKGFMWTAFDSVNIPLAERAFYLRRALKDKNGQGLKHDASGIVKDYFKRMYRGEELGLMLISPYRPLAESIAYNLAEEISNDKYDVGLNVYPRALEAKPHGQLIRTRERCATLMWIEVVGEILFTQDVFCLVYDRAHNQLGCVVLEFEKRGDVNE